MELAEVPINELVCIENVELYSVIRNKIMTFVEKWMELDIIMLSKINQSHGRQ
jgi:hypothetical protein